MGLVFGLFIQISFFFFFYLADKSTQGALIFCFFSLYKFLTTAYLWLLERTLSESTPHLTQNRNLIQDICNNRPFKKICIWTT